MDCDCEWVPIERACPKIMEIVAFWVENKMQPVPGRAYFGRYIGIGEYDLGRDMDHYVREGLVEVTHWRRFVGPQGQSPEGR